MAPREDRHDDRPRARADVDGRSGRRGAALDLARSLRAGSSSRCSAAGTSTVPVLRHGPRRRRRLRAQPHAGRLRDQRQRQGPDRSRSSRWRPSRCRRCSCSTAARACGRCWIPCSKAPTASFSACCPGDRTAIASFADRFQMRPAVHVGSRRAARTPAAISSTSARASRRSCGTRSTRACSRSRREPNRRVIVLLSDGKNWVTRRSRRCRGPGSRAPASPPPPGSRGKPGLPPPLPPSSPGPGSMPGSSAPNYASGARGAAVISSAIARDIMVYTIAMWTMTDEKIPERRSGPDAGSPTRPAAATSSCACRTTSTPPSRRSWRSCTISTCSASRRPHSTGKNTRLEVRVKQSGMRARARRSYIASVDGDLAMTRGKAARQRHKAEGRSVERTIACHPSSREQLASVSRFLTFASAFCLAEQDLQTPSSAAAPMSSRSTRPSSTRTAGS